MSGERMEVGAKCYENSGECQGNVWECAQSDGNGGECRVMPGEQNGVGAKCQGNAGECRRMPGEHVRVGAKC